MTDSHHHRFVLEVTQKQWLETRKRTFRFMESLDKLRSLRNAYREAQTTITIQCLDVLWDAVEWLARYCTLKKIAVCVE